jgi:opacity protein-like surface antigen
MKSITSITCLFFLSCSAVFAGHEFARVSVMRLDYIDSDLATKNGAGVSAGIDFGSQEQHQVSIEVSRASWSWTSSSFVFAGTSMLGGSGSITPVLLSYRYSLGQSGARIRAYGGASVGATKFSGNILFNGSGLRYGGPTDKVRPSAAAQIGISGAITDRLSYDLGYRYFYTDGFDVDTSIRKIPFPKTSAHVLALSVAVKL